MAVVRIFTPAYRYQIDARHAAFVFALWRELERRGWDVEWKFSHSSVLPQLRSDALHEAISEHCRYLISVDADVWVPDASAVVSVLGEMRGRACVGAICPQRDGRPNAWISDGERIRELPARGEILNVAAIGYGLMIHDLEWYRAEDRPAGHWYACIPSMHIEGGRAMYVGEDVWHCRAVRNAGGTVGAVSVGAVHAGVIGL